MDCNFKKPSYEARIELGCKRAPCFGELQGASQQSQAPIQSNRLMAGSSFQPSPISPEAVSTGKGPSPLEGFQIQQVHITCHSVAATGCFVVSGVYVCCESPALAGGTSNLTVCKGAKHLGAQENARDPNIALRRESQRA